MESRRALRTGPTSTIEATVPVTGQRLYQLIRQPAPIADRLFEIDYVDPGVEVFVPIRLNRPPERPCSKIPR
jgi:hypothetical protein